MKNIILIACILSMFTLSSNELKIEKVSLFKNGFGYFNSNIRLDDSTEIKIIDVPVQTHGTFWIKYPKKVDVKRIYSTITDIKEERDFDSISILLEINLGKEVKIVKDSENSKSIGTISSVKNNILVLKTKSGTEVIKIDNIYDFTFTDNSIETMVSYDKQVKELNIELNKSAPKEEIELDFMSKGITWAPSYVIDITNPNKAVLTAKALIINEAVDLEDVDVDFITGFPGIMFSHMDSPIAKTTSLYTFLNSSTTPQEISFGGSAITQQSRIMSNDISFSQSVPDYNPPKDVKATEDLFFYPVENITLKKGDTAYVPLFTMETDYKHIYTSSISDRVGIYRNNQKADKPVVFHSIKIKNRGSLPWTTAPVQFISNGNFVGQDISNYTPAGSEGIIKINNAVNVSVDDKESEIKRVRDAEKFNRYQYDLVTLTGEILVKNSMNETIDMEIDKTISGDVYKVSDSGKVLALGNGLEKINPNSKIEWKVKLKPLEEKKLTYQYSVYIRD